MYTIIYNAVKLERDPVASPKAIFDASYVITLLENSEAVLLKFAGEWIFVPLYSKSLTCKAYFFCSAKQVCSPS